MLAERNDEELMTAYGTGDASAFEVLYARHRGPLFRFMLRQIREHGTAEELAADEDVRRLYLGRNFELRRKDYLHEEAQIDSVRRGSAD